MRRVGRGRRIAAHVIAGASALFWAILFFGIIDLAVPVDETPGFYEAYLLETGWGVLYTFLVAAAFAVLAARPSFVMPIAQLVTVALCLAATAVASGSWVQLIPAVLLAVNTGIVVALDQDRTAIQAWPAPRLDPALGLVAAAAVLPSALFALDMVRAFRSGRPPLDDDTHGIDHWPTQAAMALAIAAVAVVVAVGVRAQWSGVVACAACVAVAAGWFGYWSVAYPDHAGSAGEGWGVALVVWAAVFIVVAGWRLWAARSPGNRPDTA